MDQLEDPGAEPLFEADGQRYAPPSESASVELLVLERDALGGGRRGEQPEAAHHQSELGRLGQGEISLGAGERVQPTAEST